MNEDGSKGNELSLVISPPMRQIRKTWVFFVCHIFKMRGQHKWWWENTKGWFGGRYFAVGIHQLSNFSLAYQKKKKKTTWELFWLCHLNLFRRRKLWVLRAIINSEGNHTDKPPSEGVDSCCPIPSNGILSQKTFWIHMARCNSQAEGRYVRTVLSRWDRNDVMPFLGHKLNELGNLWKLAEMHSSSPLPLTLGLIKPSH